MKAIALNGGWRRRKRGDGGEERSRISLEKEEEDFFSFTCPSASQLLSPSFPEMLESVRR
jgi:hypothetical protein